MAIPSHCPKPFAALLALLARTVALTAAVIGVLQLLHGHLGEVHPLPPLLHWGRDAALALPIGLLAVWTCTRVASRTTGDPRRRALAGALAGGGVFGVLSVPGGVVHQRLFVAEHEHGSFLAHSAADGLSTWLLALATLLALAALAHLRLPRSGSSRRPLAASLATVLVLPLGVVVSAATPASAAPVAASCTVTRSYDVAAIDLDIPYNRWGTNATTGATNLDADGMMYVLQQDKAAVKNWDVPLNHVRAADGSYQPGADPAAGRRLRPRPLVLRANAGECVKVTLTNELTGPQFGGTLTNPRVSIHPHGVSYQVRTTDGTALEGADGSTVGFNDDPTVGIGETKVYDLTAPAQEGAYLFHDHGAIAGSQADGGATVHGLFGALAVQPKGSSWFDPVSGAQLDTATPYSAVAGQSGELYLDAFITNPAAVTFRESVQLAHDEIPGIGFGFNYGSEPAERREEKLCGDCVGEETSLSSWTYGDPALVKLASGKGPWLPTVGQDKVEDCGLRRPNASGKLVGSCWTSNVTHAYAKDPIKFRYGLAGVKETHVFHMHAHQWLIEPHDNAPVGTPDDPNGNLESTKVDSQTFGPGDMFTAELIGGAGSIPGTVGDTIFHCHLYPHFAEGFWSLFRVHDVLEDGSGTTPDGIGVVALRPLPDRAPKPAPTATSPGYPRFIPGQVGWRAPQPYLGISEANGKTDDPATVAREDVTQARRVVAGRYLDPAVLDKVQKVTSTSGGTAEIQEIGNDSAPRAEVQEITVTATGGTFTIGADLEALPHAAGDLAVETVVERVTAKTVTMLPATAAAGSKAWQFSYDVPGNVPDLAVNGALLTTPGPNDVSSGTPVPTTVPGSATVRVEQGAGGGSFTLAVGASTTAALPYNASALEVQAALTALTPAVTATVTSPAAQRWVLTYKGVGDAAEPVVNGSALTSGTATVSTTTPGVAPSSFTLRFGGETTGPIAHGAAPAQVKAALEALGTIDDVDPAKNPAGGAEVTGAGPYDVKLLRWSRTDSLVLSATGATVDVDPALKGATAAETTRIAHTAHALMVEKGALAAAHAAVGTKVLPGSPFVDPCPAGKRTVTYNVSVIQRDVVYNEAGWHDTQGRLYVLDKDVDAVVAGTKEPEPLFIRVNAGDCINFNLTSYLPNWIGDDAFLKLAQTNMVGGHIHLVKFDVLGSDGSSNGWNYQEAAFSKEQMDFNAQTDAGTRSCTPALCRLTDADANYSPVGTGPNGSQGRRGQTIHERWYADSELRTVFTHDHHFPAVAQNRGQYGALVVEPAATQMRNPFTGTFYKPGTGCTAPDAVNGCNGDAFGTNMDIIGLGTNDDFREFGLSFQDFVSLTKKGGNPKLASDTFNPPATPEHYPNEDPGVMGVNYRNAPFLLRDTKNGQWVDPAYRFSSTVFGDPKTPLLQAYSGDQVRIRMIQGSQEEQHVFALHGMRWREEPDDPQSPLVASKSLGISDAPNFEIPKVSCGIDEDCKGDFLYSSTSTDATYLGMWGLMRVYGKPTDKLLPLPDNVLQGAGGSSNETVTGIAPEPVPEGKKGGSVCPTLGAKTFAVFATDGRIDYNKQGDHDPYGLMYGVVKPGETMDAAVERVRREQEPMVLRANEGDCLEVRLTNRIDPAGAFATQHAPVGASRTDPNGGDPKLPLEPPTGTRAGLRVSLHPQLLKYDVRYSDGATVGFSKDQTVGPGQSILYRWWADDVTPGELGATNLVDFGDVRGHRHHGLFAGLIVEPKGSTYTDAITGEPVISGAQADIRVPDPQVEDFREAVPFFQDGLNLRDAQGRPVVLPSHGGVAQPLDSEDEGEKAFNYRSPRFAHRGDPLRELPGATGTGIDGRVLADVFDSARHGDPDTPLFRAYAGDAMRVRVLQGSDKPRQHSYQLSGHSWRSQAHDPGSNLVGTSGGFSVSRTLDVHTRAGGERQLNGDFRYNCGVSFHHQSGGLWGIQRVYSAPPKGWFAPSPLGSGRLAGTADDPHRLGYVPIQPLGQRTVTAHVYDDTNRNRLRGNDEKPLANVPVRLHLGNGDGTTGAQLETRRTDARGQVVFQVPEGAYDVVVPAPTDFAATTPTTMRLSASKGGAAQRADFGQVQLANLAVRAYNDQNGNLVADPGEAAMEGWTVSLTGEGRTASAAVTGGTAAFGDLLPGSYSTTVTPGAGYYSTTHKAMPVAISVAENADLTGDREVRVGYALKAGLSVRVYNDSNDNGTQEPGESSLASRKVEAKGGPEGAVTAVAETNVAGNASLDDPDPAIDGLVPGVYDVTQLPGVDWRLSKATRTVTRADGTATADESLPVTGSTVNTGVQEKTSQVLTLRNHNPKGWVSAVAFNDLNNDGVRQDREGKLVGWRAYLHTATGTYIGETTTDNSGRATWYVAQAGGVQAPVGYTVQMAPQEVASTEIPWTATTSGTASVGAVSGEERAGAFGFVRLGTVQAMVWHDLDRDGVDSGRGEEVMANRTVRLYDAGGKTLLQQKVTDSGGLASFKTSTGIDYQLEVLLPTGWTATAPRSANGTPLTRLKVVGPSGLLSVLTRFGQYNTNDRTPPPDPTLRAVPETNGSQTVTLSSEAGASFRYTLDGSLPTLTTGMSYLGPITVSSTKVLTAIALDAAGNASGVVSSTYDIAGGSTAPTAAPASWTPITGTTRGTVADVVAKDDARRLFLTAAPSGNTHVTDGYGTHVVPVSQRKLLGLGVAYEGRASTSGVTRSLEMYNWAGRRYEVVRAAEAEAPTDSRTVVDVGGDPKRFMNATTGEIRLKARGSATGSFELGADQVSFTVRFTP